MSLQSPSRLLELAGRSLLRNRALTIFTLDELPREVFPLMFMEAFSMRHCEALKLMVQAWPFLRLPLGSLMKTPHLETLRAALKGLDTLLAQKVRPRCLKNPLRAFIFCHAYLADRDMECLSQYPSLSQLKELHLIHILMWTTNLEPLGALLEKAAATLEILTLKDCRIQDSQLRVLLPALSRCSQLTTFYFGGNETSTNALTDLLRHTGGLSKLGLELYPAPLESLDHRGHVNWEILAPIRAELMRTLREVRQPKRIFFGPVPCPSCGSWPSETVDFHLCS
ncbi:PREDICTED: PRAME family member 10-like [Mandrillus leucophaeus]|uniref:PRAME family member 10-like n=1 Tax=Mandrillus leucophaeus TaxID=9568 RepID=UPI0005F45B54|nr:PREDICTED: PRAME family member 10-like [Mandrillus leucophaeus]